MAGLSVARAALIILLILVLCWQGLVALFHLVDSPVGSKETLGLPEYSDYFPALTICPFTEPSIGRSIMVSPEYTFTETIDQRSTKVNVYQSFYNVTKLNNPMLRSARNATVHKTYVHIAMMYVQECQTFTYTPDEDWYPLMFNLVLDWDNLSQVTFYVHQHKDILPECTEPYGQFNIQVKGPTKPGTLQTRYFVVRDYKMNGLPRKDLPCQEVADDEDLRYDGGIGKCIYEYMEDKMNCKLPWTSGGSKELKNCTTSDHLMNFKDLSISMMYLGEPNYYNLTKCLQPCKYYHFQAKQMLVTDENSTLFGADKKTLAAHFFHPQVKMTVEDEYFVNDFNYFLGNVGGLVGLLIGASILTIVDYTLELLQRGTKKFG